MNRPAVTDGKYTNLYCPECQAHPDDYEIVFDAHFKILQHPYCEGKLNGAIDGADAETQRVYVRSEVVPDRWIKLTSTF